MPARAQNSRLPLHVLRWFAERGWTPRPHQLAIFAMAQAQEDALLIAPTGAGKTLAGFLPSLVDIGRRRDRGLHTLYISPLKALAVDIARNLEMPVKDMGLEIRLETRTGDTSPSKRQRQRRDPPDILLTTPEQLALLLASADAKTLFADLQRIVIDELHAIAASKRGDLLALGLARLRGLAPKLRVLGLSATVRDPDELRRWLVGQTRKNTMAALVTAPAGAAPEVAILDTHEHLPWSGHTSRHALAEVYARIKAAHMVLVFVNTRALAEFVFQELWRINEDNLPIALHHGSLDVGQRRRVEAAMAAGKLKAIVCTSTLDLGVDWGDVDLVINIGAPKGASRLMQRIGRANHRLDEPSRALLVPSNRFEVLECVAAIDAVRAGTQDTALARSGALDVLCQHILGTACAEAFDADTLFSEVVSAEPYAALERETFEAALAFVAHGGYALASYERFAKIKRRQDGRWRIVNPRVAQTYRMNVGTIVEADMLKVRLVRGGPQDAKGLIRDPCGGPAGCSARSRNIFCKRSRRTTRFSSAARSWRCAALSRTRLWCPARLPRRRKFLLMRAENFLSRRISPRACGRFSPIRANGRRCRNPCRNGSPCRNAAPACRARASFSSRRFRAAKNFTSLLILSRGDWRIRPSACC